jgi:hypothetical protein
MKWIAASLLLISLNTFALAQSNQAADSGDTSGLRIADNPNIPLDQRPQPGFKKYKTAGQPDVVVWVPEHRTVGCYTMRVIHFERDGTDPPRRLGETTCTPAKALVKRATRSPEARLVPAN